MNEERHGALTEGNHAALWSGRFSEGPDADAIDFETSILWDSRMIFDDIEGSRAHAKMLCAQKIISNDECEKIICGLNSIQEDLKSQKLKIDQSAEDVHSFLEATLTDRIGDAGKKIHTGRSRNDQIALDERLYLRRIVKNLQGEIVSLVKNLTKIALQHTKTLISGYTHLQRAQPITLAHHLCAWAWPLTRDFFRLKDALSRISLCPLGSGALAGTTLALDRQMTSELLGFSAPTPNSLDSVSDRDFCLEFASCFAILQMHLSRMCEEVVLWSTAEFSFIELSEKWSTGSSIMPQKKNPDFAELIRGRTGKVYGDLISLFVMMKGLPLSYNRDLQEDKAALFDSYEICISCVKVFSKMISSAKFNTKNMAKSCTGGFSNATDIAEYLVKKGVPFRTSHAIAAQCVKKCIEKGFSSIENLKIEELKSISPLFENDIFDKISAECCVESRNVFGGPSSECVLEQISALKKFCEENSDLK